MEELAGLSLCPPTIKQHSPCASGTGATSPNMTAYIPADGVHSTISPTERLPESKLESKSELATSV